jgi:regulator of protease activity HflC (stomatin/prohibitin superfamily)
MGFKTGSQSGFRGNSRSRSGVRKQRNFGSRPSTLPRAAAFTTSTKKEITLGKVIGGFVALVALVVSILLIMSSATIGARSVGVETRFGKYVSTVDSGHHWLNPFSSVEEFSTLTQSLHLDGAEGDDHGQKTNVAFKGGASGNASVTVRWRITDDGVSKLWHDYKTFENVRDNLVTSDAQNSIRTEFSNYTPTDAIDGNNLNTIMENVQGELGKKLKAYGITVDSIQVTNVALGKQAQASLDRIVQANADIQRAQAEQQKATIEAQTATIRQQSQTPESLLRYCLDVVNAWDAAKNGPLPATFNCQLGTAGQTPVIVNGR